MTTHRWFGDDSLALLTHGYRFGARIWRRRGAGARSAPMRLLGDDTILVRGPGGGAFLRRDAHRPARRHARSRA